MTDAADYLAHIKALVVANPAVIHWELAREEDQDDKGLLRYRLTLRDNSLLEMFELFQIVGEEVTVVKYSFHWQDPQGQLRKRWDNAAHHPEVATYPYHVHDGAEANVLSHGSINVEGVLAFIATAVSETPDS